MPLYKILVVDDELTQRKMICEILSVSTEHKYQVVEAGDGLQALEILKVQDFDAVLLDKRMPIMDGDELCRRIRAIPTKQFLPIVMVTGTNSMDELARSFTAGANDFVRKPYSPLELTTRLNSAVRTKRLTDHLDSAESLLFALARMVEAKDETTGDHCTRLAHISVVFGQELGLSEEELNALRRGGVLHDIGKLGIPDSILLKQGSLSDEEWVVMRSHTTIGAHLCGGLATMRMVVPIIMSHHERWDGSGYPHGLSGQSIPLLARVFQIADIYDALASARPYKTAFTTQQIVEVFQKETDKGWRDKELVDVFLNILLTRKNEFNVPENRIRSLDENIFEAIASTGALNWDRPGLP
jgi:putative two-component system response regulator